MLEKFGDRMMEDDVLSQRIVEAHQWEIKRTRRGTRNPESCMLENCGIQKTAV